MHVPSLLTAKNPLTYNGGAVSEQNDVAEKVKLETICFSTVSVPRL